MARSRAPGCAIWRVGILPLGEKPLHGSSPSVRFASGERSRGVKPRNRSPAAPPSGQLAPRSGRPRVINHLDSLADDPPRPRHRPRLRRAAARLRPVARRAADPPGLIARGRFGAARAATRRSRCPRGRSMTSSEDPGQLGFYGFREPQGPLVRRDGVRELALRCGAARLGPPRRARQAGRSCSACRRRIRRAGQRGAWSPASSRRRHDPQYTYPAELKDEIEDARRRRTCSTCRNFRTERQGARSCATSTTMTEQRFTVARAPLETRPWDFFMMVEMGLDRIHHGFWQLHGPEHPQYEPGNPFEHAIRDYYRYVDGEIGRAARARSDTTPPSSSSPITARRGWTAGSASTSG